MWLLTLSLFLRHDHIVTHVSMYTNTHTHTHTFPGGTGVKNPPANAGTQETQV